MSTPIRWRTTRRGGAVASLGAGLLAGCSWLPTFVAPANPDVYGACAAWVSHVNAMDACVEVTYDAKNLCAAADAQPPEMADYYRCLTETARCTGADLELGAASCSPPLVALSAERELGP